MAKVLVIRTSSFGDVALLAPVVYSVATHYPKDRFSVMTRQAYAPIFDHLGFNVNVIPVDTKKKHKGIFGLMKLVSKSVRGGYSHVADTHDVLRSKVIRYSMFLTFSKVAKIDKGRDEKNWMISSKQTEPPLMHATERYMQVFEKLGFSAEMVFKNLYDFKPRVFERLQDVITLKSDQWIGIAPFAQHQGKVYPIAQMEQLVEKLSRRENTKLFLFGFGKGEMAIMNDWTNKYPAIVPHHDKLNLDRELLLISYLDVMISMDSANMHLASLVEVPVVSIWGATHPSLGFYGFGQDINNAVQLDLDCRPCSVFGNTPCIYKEEREEYKCMKGIEVDRVIAKIEEILQKKIRK